MICFFLVMIACESSPVAPQLVVLSEDENRSASTVIARCLRSSCPGASVDHLF